MKLFYFSFILVAAALGFSTHVEAGLAPADSASQFVGAYQTKLSYILINSSAAETLEMHGKDAMSYWDAQCDRKKSVNYICTGAGNGEGGKFTFRSELVFKNGAIEETWTIEDVVKGGKVIHGTDQFVPLRIAPAR